jgi:acetyl-CoA carboxylase carboxyl transferase subunit alpha
MSSNSLDFEAPIQVILERIELLKLRPRTPERHEELQQLRLQVDSLREEIYSKLSPWQQVLVARHPNRPHTLDYVDQIFSEFTEFHGDRRFGDDPAIVCGLAYLHKDPVVIVGHQKGRGTRENIRRNFGYAKPEGYRKALRAMRLAEKFQRPVVAFVDTPAAYPGLESEERGVAEAIATNLREMSMLRVPILVVISGEGGSGGALGLALGDRIMIQEHSIFSVIPPEGCAAILWRDPEKKISAAEALKITAPDLVKLQVVDEVIPEPLGGAHVDPKAAAKFVKVALVRNLETVSQISIDELVTARYQKYRRMGDVGLTTRTTDSTELSKAGSEEVDGSRGQGNSPDR